MPAQRLERPRSHDVGRAKDSVQIRMPVQQRLHCRGAALLAEVAGLLKRFIGLEACLQQSVAVALQPVDPGAHVQRAGDRRDSLATGGDEVLDSRARPSHVVDVHVGHWAARSGPASEHDQRAAFMQAVGQRIVPVQRHHEHAVHVAGGQVALEPGLVTR